MSPQQRPLIVIVEDDRSLAATLHQQLADAGFATQTFHKGATALKFIEEHHVHLVLLDPTLPDLDGLTVLERIRKSGAPAAVIFLASVQTPSAIVKALEAGADDFIGKPYHPEELAARIHAVLRRSETAGDSRLTRNADLATNVFHFNGAEVHPERLELVFGPGKSCKLGRKEIGILYHLHANPGVIISRNSLIHAVWGVHANVRSRSLDQYIAKIREAFQKLGRGLECFRTIHGIGYWYEPEATGKSGKKIRRA
jgi:two-component system alkaline phosphatase synthesis response regulator PhoP